MSCGFSHYNECCSLRLKGVQLVPTGPAQLVLSHTVWLFLYTVECCYIEIGRSAVGCYGNCSAASLCDVCLNFCIFKLCPEWPHVNVVVLLRSLSWENFNGRVKCTFEYPTFSGKSLSLEKIRQWKVYHVIFCLNKSISTDIIV